MRELCGLQNLTCFLTLPGAHPLTIRNGLALGDIVSLGFTPSTSAIACSFMPLADWRPLVKRCLAAMHRMWSSKTNLEVRIALLFCKSRDGTGEKYARTLRREGCPSTTMCRARESDGSPLIWVSWRRPTNLTMAQPAFFMSGSTRMSWRRSVTRKRGCFSPFPETTVQERRSALSGK